MDFLYLVPIALVMGAIGLGAFLWSLQNGQYDDLDGAAERILHDDQDAPAADTCQSASRRESESSAI